MSRKTRKTRKTRTRTDAQVSRVAASRGEEPRREGVMSRPSIVLVDGKKPCTKCKAMLPIERFYTTGKKANGEFKYNSWCKACIKDKQASYHEKTWGPEKLQYTASKRTRSVRSYMSYLLAKAKQRKQCSIDINFLDDLWKKQNGLCALTGWPMTMVLGKGKVYTNASIDRIDALVPYTEQTVQLVCLAANVAKNDLSHDMFVSLCLAIANKNGIQNRSVAA
jgi:hypothetical protein